MSSSDIFTLVVERTRPEEPWGIRLQGGTDCREPLSVFKVRRRSPAERAGVKIGDLVLAINDTSTSSLTHQQMLDLVSRQHLALRLTLSRPVMDGGVVRWSATDDSRHHARARDARSSSPGLLAFIPFAVAQNAAVPQVPQLTFGSCYGDPTSMTSSYKPSYRAPPYRTSNQHQPKSYQPLDMTGKHAFYSPPMSYSHLPAREYYSSGPSSWDVGSTYSTHPSSTMSSPSDSADQLWRLSRSAYYSDDLQPSSFSMPQSRSFLLLKTALQAECARGPGFPPAANTT